MYFNGKKMTSVFHVWRNNTDTGKKPYETSVPVQLVQFICHYWCTFGIYQPYSKIKCPYLWSLQADQFFCIFLFLCVVQHTSLRQMLILVFVLCFLQNYWVYAEFYGSEGRRSCFTFDECAAFFCVFYCGLQQVFDSVTLLFYKLWNSHCFLDVRGAVIISNTFLELSLLQWCE